MQLSTDLDSGGWCYASWPAPGFSGRSCALMTPAHMTCRSIEKASCAISQNNSRRSDCLTDSRCRSSKAPSWQAQSAKAPRQQSATDIFLGLVCYSLWNSARLHVLERQRSRSKPRSRHCRDSPDQIKQPAQLELARKQQYEQSQESQLGKAMK